MAAHLFLCALILTIPNAQARLSAQEIAALPPYCAGRLQRETNHAEYKRWEDQYGPSFLHVHHMCYGIAALNRYRYDRSNDPQKKRALLDEAISELSYVISHFSKDSALLPEAYLYQSTAFKLRKDYTSALQVATLALQLNRRSANAYHAIADVYEATGKKEDALSILKEGLSHMPDDKRLRRRYLGLGGNLPDDSDGGKTEPERAETDKQVKVNGAALADTALSSAENLRDDDQAAKARKKNYAAYSFSKSGRGGMHHGYNAGEYVLLEVTEGKKGNEVVFRVTSRIPEPHSRVGSIWFDLGRYQDMFIKLETDHLLGKYYHVMRDATPFQHAFLPGLNARYRIEFSIDPRIGKPNDPRRLSPGSSLAITATLAPGYRYEDVIAALNRGLTTDDGLRIAIIGLHLAGKPLPSGTRMDDGGYFTGRLLRASGPHAERQASAAKAVKQAAPAPAATPDPAAPATPAPSVEPARTQGAESVPSGKAANPRNPWCRFCPE